MAILVLNAPPSAVDNEDAQAILVTITSVDVEDEDAQAILIHIRPSPSSTKMAVLVINTPPSAVEDEDAQAVLIHIRPSPSLTKMAVLVLNAPPYIVDRPYHLQNAPPIKRKRGSTSSSIQSSSLTHTTINPLSQLISIHQYTTIKWRGGIIPNTGEFRNSYGRRRLWHEDV